MQEDLTNYIKKGCDKMRFEDIETIEHVKRYNAENGRDFFSLDTMRFFNSRVESGIRKVKGGILFITSEQFDDESPRLYTLRKMKESGRADSLPKFQGFKAFSEAKQAMEGYTEEVTK